MKIQHIFLCLGIYLCGSHVAILPAQSIPSYPVSLFILDDEAEQPLCCCEARVYCQLNTGEYKSENPRGTTDDVFTTGSYPVGSVVEIVLNRDGFKRQTIQHTVNPNPLLNRRDVRMVPSTRDSVGLLVEGDLYYVEDSIRYPANGEIVRFFTSNGIKNITVGDNGYYKFQLDEASANARETIRMRAAYVGDKFDSQDTTISTKTHYHLINFELTPLLITHSVELQIKDKREKFLLGNASIQMFCGSKLIASGLTNSSGYFSRSIQLHSKIQEISIRVAKEGYSSENQQFLANDITRTIFLDNLDFKIQGTTANGKKRQLPVEIFADSILIGKTKTAKNGDYEITIARDSISTKTHLRIRINNYETWGSKDLLLPDVASRNSTEVPRINTFNRSGKWKDQVHIGLGVSSDTTLNPLMPSLELGLGTRKLPNVVLGINLIQFRMNYTDSIRVFSSMSKPLLTTKNRSISPGILLKYYVGLPSIPRFNAMVGASLAVNLQKVYAGLQFSGPSLFKFEMAVGYYHYRWKGKKSYEFNYFGPPIIHLENLHLNGWTFSATIIKKILW